MGVVIVRQCSMFAVTKALGCFGAPALKLNAKLRASEENGVDILGHHWVGNWLGS